MKKRSLRDFPNNTQTLLQRFKSSRRKETNSYRNLDSDGVRTLVG
jgi:hypothetical protein